MTSTFSSTVDGGATLLCSNSRDTFFRMRFRVEFQRFLIALSVLHGVLDEG